MISIIIPTLNVAADLEPLLAQIGKAGAEIVISDGGSTDGTLRVALDYQARLALGCAGRGWQLARGAEWAEGDWLFFVHADTILPDEWDALIKNHIAQHPGKAGYFKFGLNAKGARPRILECLANLRTWFFGLPYGDQGLLISRELYTSVDGYPDWELFEDVAIIRKLGRARLKPIRGKILTSADKFARRGYFKSWLRNASLITRYTFGADPVKLAKIYNK